MASLERTYVIPLRKSFMKVPVYKRSRRAVIAVRDFLIRHMKVKEVKIGKELNDKIFSRGYKKPPPRIQVTAIKDGDIVKVNLTGIPYKDAKEEKEPKLKELEKPKKEELEKIAEEAKKIKEEKANSEK